MTDTQPQPGRALDVKMWRDVLRRKVYDMTAADWDGAAEREYPCMILGEHDNNYIVQVSEYDVKMRDWQPSTNIAHAFEVQRDGWRWDFIEEDLRIRVYLTYRRSDNWQSVIADGVLWEEMPDRASAYALARCRCALAWWQAQKQNRH